ncbi:hypothetical protein IE81DRAFT_320252 [Ceraceosorus guamensis]|uniref:Uncharacterized protein n=1 Tax=Ceraceosorus guamensis TaxID=1522189 RepID=A0A316W6D8_9BASI|nr:hypothetical protein IE81DRAFT_320252 [Ceraceosorus guamensis]PWN45490.1 hypothetical protein IE81DRAFT_320252 [Ceraceosorus guamensis]
MEDKDESSAKADDISQLPAPPTPDAVGDWKIASRQTKSSLACHKPARRVGGCTRDWYT